MKYLIVLYITHYAIYVCLSKPSQGDYKLKNARNENSLNIHKNITINEKIQNITEQKVNVSENILNTTINKDFDISNDGQPENKPVKCQNPLEDPNDKAPKNISRIVSYKRRNNTLKRRKCKKKQKDILVAVFEGGCPNNKERAEDGTCVSLEDTGDTPEVTTENMSTTTAMAGQPINIWMYTDSINFINFRQKYL